MNFQYLRTFLNWILKKCFQGDATVYSKVFSSNKNGDGLNNTVLSRRKAAKLNFHLTVRRQHL